MLLNKQTTKQFSANSSARARVSRFCTSTPFTFLHQKHLLSSTLFWFFTVFPFSLRLLTFYFTIHRFYTYSFPFFSKHGLALSKKSVSAVKLSVFFARFILIYSFVRSPPNQPITPFSLYVSLPHSKEFARKFIQLGFQTLST